MQKDKIRSSKALLFVSGSAGRSSLQPQPLHHRAALGGPAGGHRDGGAQGVDQPLQRQHPPELAGGHADGLEHRQLPAAGGDAGEDGVGEIEDAHQPHDEAQRAAQQQEHAADALKLRRVGRLALVIEPELHIPGIIFQKSLHRGVGLVGGVEGVIHHAVGARVPDKGIIYSLHNAGFGGCYWYLTGGDEGLYQQLYRQPKEEGVPLNLGEPEMPYCVELYPAVFESVGVIPHYEYLAKFQPDEDPAKLITSGSSSDEYATRLLKKPVYSLVNEMPYFFDPRVDDTSPGQRSRLDCMLESFDQSEAIGKLMKELYEKLQPVITTWNPFFLAVEDRVKSYFNKDASREWAKSNPEFRKTATVAQEFDNLYSARFYLNLNMALARRTCIYEKEHAENLTAEARKILDEVEAVAGQRLAQDSAYLEEHIHYTAIPIRKLVRIQAASGLIYAQYVRDMCKNTPQ